MERKVIISTVLFFLFLVSGSVAMAMDLEFSVRLKKDKIELLSKNNIGKTVKLPWLKRSGAAFLFVSPGGELFPYKRWMLASERDYGHGSIFYCRFLEGIRFTVISCFPTDLTDFLIPESIRQEESFRLCLTVFINQSANGRLPLYQTPFYSLEVQRGKVTNLKKISVRAVPKKVLERVEKERLKILAEEKNPKFLYW